MWRPTWRRSHSRSPTVRHRTTWTEKGGPSGPPSACRTCGQTSPRCAPGQPRRVPPSKNQYASAEPPSGMERVLVRAARLEHDLHDAHDPKPPDGPALDVCRTTRSLNHELHSIVADDPSHTTSAGSAHARQILIDKIRHCCPPRKPCSSGPKGPCPRRLALPVHAKAEAAPARLKACHFPLTFLPPAAKSYIASGASCG